MITYTHEKPVYMYLNTLSVALFLPMSAQINPTNENKKQIIKPNIAANMSAKYASTPAPGRLPPEKSIWSLLISCTVTIEDIKIKIAIPSTIVFKQSLKILNFLD